MSAVPIGHRCPIIYLHPLSWPPLTHHDFLRGGLGAAGLKPALPARSAHELHRRDLAACHPDRLNVVWPRHYSALRRSRRVERVNVFVDPAHPEIGISAVVFAEIRR